MYAFLKAHVPRGKVIAECLYFERWRLRRLEPFFGACRSLLLSLKPPLKISHAQVGFIPAVKTFCCASGMKLSAIVLTL